MITRQMRTLWLSETLQALRQVLVGEGLFQVKHKWRFKKLPSVSVLAFVLQEVGAGQYAVQTKAEDNRTEMQSSGFAYGNYSSFFISSSLRSSLISREGVCMRVHACLLIVGVQIWWFTITSEFDVLSKYVRKQKEKRELSILRKIQVVNDHFLKERRLSLLILIKRYMLLVMIQQRQKWKKCYKTWMFKYKARLKQVQVLLLHVVLSHWRSSCFTGIAGEVRTSPRVLL